MTKNIQTRLVTKHAKEAEWKNSDLIILNGELIIYDPDETHAYSRVKIGNGTSRAEELPFIDESILDQVDFSYDYNDLINTPVLPKYVSDLDDDLGIATTQYVDLVKKEIPTLISQLENDLKYVDESDLEVVRNEIPDISNLADKQYVDSMVSTIPQFEIMVVETLPTENISNTVVYLLKPTSEDADNFYDEYIYVNNNWELLGSARLDLANYAKIENIPTKVSELENDSKFVSEDSVEDYFKRLNSDNVLRFYCIEDVTIVNNGVSTVYPANSNVEVKFLGTDVWEIIPTSDNSILALNGFPGALGTYYSWLEGVKQFSNILFDMNDVDFYSKWSQGNQGAYQVQYAQYVNCIFWSDNPYVSDVSKRTNYTLYYTAQLPLCYSSIPDNTFKAFYLAFNVNNDPNWGNKAYRDSFAKATWATQVFSYYGARTIGVFGHDDPDFNIILPKDCRGLFCEATAVENAGTFDAINVTNFGAKSGSWRDAFRMCSSLRQLYIKNLKVNLNVSWSPLDYASIYFIISKAANTNKITISVSPYTYNLLGPSDFELATSKNIVIEKLTTNYTEDRRLSAITITGDGTQVLSNDGTYKALPTKTSQLENDSSFLTEHQSLTDVLVKTEQTLTEEELIQVRKNLKFIGKDVEGQQFTIDGQTYTASANAEIFGDYTSNIAIGQWSIAEGSGTIAKGRASHAEGAMTKALNDGTHTEGYQTEATGYWSHAEGELTKVTSYASHAEGSYCTLPDGQKRYGTASGYASHIEGGGCLATGSCSHAEGLATTVNGAQSHAEGRYTIASGGAQHVEGIANIEDAEGKYIHIAGNGSFDAPSNAYTLDWNGNGWFAGNVEATSIILRSSTEGSNKKFRLTIDDNGVLSAEEVTE